MFKEFGMMPQPENSPEKNKEGADKDKNADSEEEKSEKHSGEENQAAENNSSKKDEIQIFEIPGGWCQVKNPKKIEIIKHTTKHNLRENETETDQNETANLKDENSETPSIEERSEIKNIPKKRDNSEFSKMPENFWYQVIEKVSRKTGETPTPKEIRANLTTKLLRIPQGWTSGLDTQNIQRENRKIEAVRQNIKLDKLLAKYFTNNTIKMEDTPAGPATSSDPRDFNNIEDHLEEFKNEVKKLETGQEKGMQIYSIIKSELENIKNLKENDRADKDFQFIYLPGGIPLFLRGYWHEKKWQSQFEKHLAETYSQADYIAIEGASNYPLGSGLDIFWSSPNGQLGHYDRLMKDLVKNGFDGNFLEIDARNTSKIKMDNFLDKDGRPFFPELPKEFYEIYFNYLQREDPALIKKIKTPENLKKFLMMQSTTGDGFLKRDYSGDVNMKNYHFTTYVENDFSDSTLPTGMEMGQLIFSDALAAIKLHKLAQAMNEGRIKKGTIVDFEGSDHLSSKSFFLKYPQYAAEIVLRTLNELMTHRAGDRLTQEEEQTGKNRPENLEKLYSELSNPDFSSAFAKIGEIPIFDIENDPNKTVEIGPNQNKLYYNSHKSIDAFDGIDHDMLHALCDDDYIQQQIDDWKKKNQ